MANLIITKGWVDGQALTKSQLDTSMDDISTWLNARDNASASWLNLSVDSTAATPVVITSNASTTTLKVNNTATDGDPKLSLQLSGVEKVAFYVDDSDNDYGKIDTSSGTALTVGQGAKWIGFAHGTTSLPGIGVFDGTTNNKGFYGGTNMVGVTIAATGQVKFTDGTIEPITDNDIDLGTTTARMKNSYQYGMVLVDGVTAPSTITGHAIIYVDTSDGDLKIKFGDGTVKTIVVDS